VAAAKARQAEEERIQKENRVEGDAAATAIKATPLAVSALPTTWVAPPTPSPTASLKRAENGSNVFVTEDPLVVKRPAAAVLTQRMNAAEASAAVATPIPAPPPPTRLPGTKAIPASLTRISNGTAETKALITTPAFNDTPRVSENLPMRRPPSEVYSKGRRSKSANLIFSERQKPKRGFPWAIVGFVFAVGIAAAALIMFALSAPKLVNTPVLQPDKLTFTWKSGTPKPGEQVLRLKGGAASSSFTATSSDEEWLTVTPESEEPTNRSWQVKVDPQKVGPTGPNGTSGWIDVASTEGFKTQEEVIVKVAAADAAPVVTETTKKPTVMEPPKEHPATAAAAGKKALAALPLTEKSTPAANVVGDSAKTMARKPVIIPAPAVTAKKQGVTPPPAIKKPPTTDGTDIN
jgi:hypothetical protein